MLRGTPAERYAVYAIGLENGILSINEVRRLENLNPIKNGDEHRAGGSVERLDAVKASMGLSARAAGGARHADAGSDADKLLQSLTHDAAGRVVRRETSALPRLLEKGDKAAISDFWGSHTDFVSDALHISSDAARSYVSQQQQVAQDVDSWDVGAIITDLSTLTREEYAA